MTTICPRQSFFPCNHYSIPLMKTKLFLLVFCLFFLSVAVYAQRPASLGLPPASSFLYQHDPARDLNRPPTLNDGVPPYIAAEQDAQRRRIEAIKDSLRINWDSRSSNNLIVSIFGIIAQDPDVSIAFGVSDEQHQQIQEAPNRAVWEMQTDPEVQRIRKEIWALVERESSEPSILRHAAPPIEQHFTNVETWEKIKDLQREMLSAKNNVMSDAYNGVLTSEQMQKVRESLIANKGTGTRTVPSVVPVMFEALDLTDVQRQQMRTLEKNFESELEKHLEKYANARLRFSDMLFRTGITSGAAEKLELKKAIDEIYNQKEAVAERFKTAVRERGILTEEQWARFHDLIDNPPEHARIFGARLQMLNGGGGDATSGWQPGPDSWQPGDAIPEEYRQQRNERSTFPRPTE